MTRLAIRCHLCAPVEADEVEQWLEDELDRLRAGTPHGVLRLLRLSQPAPAGEIEIGWLIELEQGNGDPPLDVDSLTRTMRDLRLLGLQPTALEPTPQATTERAP
jgi:hypothetical protein